MKGASGLRLKVGGASEALKQGDCSSVGGPNKPGLVAVKESKLSYHNRDMWYITWLGVSGNLIKLP